MSRFFSSRLWASVFVGLLLLAFLPPVSKIARIAEDRFAPVLTGVTVEFDRTADTTSFTMSGNKRRGCDVVDLHWFVGTLDGEHQNVRIVHTDSGVKDVANYPVGLWKSREWQFADDHLYDSMFGIFRHRCHPFWDSTTVVGPFAIG